MCIVGRLGGSVVGVVDVRDYVGDVLEGAAVLLERDGWLQGRTFQTDVFADGSYVVVGRDVLGAIREAAFEVPALEVWDDQRVAFELAEWRLAEFLGLAKSRFELRTSDFFDWNDADGRTAEDVVAALRGAAQ